MKFIVSMKWVLARMYEPDVAIVDCRFALGQPESGRQVYSESHIPGAVYFDLEQDLSSPVHEKGHGGRHPLPDVEQLVDRIRKVGISNGTRIIAYDDQGGAMASRFWWLMRYLGHEQVYIMDEGFAAWQAARFPVTADVPIRIPASYTPHIQSHLLADIEDVRKASTTGAAVLIDSREYPRYLGEVEPLDKKAGHIPGAVSYFWKDNLQEGTSKLKSAEELSNRFESVSKDQEIIVYCGSGVTACPNVLALKEVGYEKVKLYAGSWSDWISYEENPVKVGNEEKPTEV